MCGCSKGNARMHQRSNSVFAPPRQVSPPVSPATFQFANSLNNSTPGTLSEEQKRIQKLRRDAIRRSLGR